MAYKNAAEVLPAHLLNQIQNYIDGGLIYIPKCSQKVAWGHLSGARKNIDQRNYEIIELYENGYNIEELSERFYLSPDTIKKIVYTKNN